jgi:hypothetical protein
MNQVHTLVAKKSFDAVIQVMGANDVAKGNAWVNQDTDTHLAHARSHLHHLNRGDGTEDHLRHAVTRLAMALAIMECDRAKLVSPEKPKAWSLDDSARPSVLE